MEYEAIMKVINEQLASDRISIEVLRDRRDSLEKENAELKEANAKLEKENAELKLALMN
jgi:FtsZ-binding cell division protein ZapB